MNLYGILLIFEKNVLMKHVFYSLFFYDVYLSIDKNKYLFKICICNSYESDFSTVFKNSINRFRKKYVSENAGTSKSFFLPLSNCVNTEINAQLPKNKLSLVDVV